MKLQNEQDPFAFTEDVCRMVIRPLVGILLRFGLPFARFSDICRSVYVDVASKEFGVDGRRTNTSRIALITGLSRTRVKQELDALTGAPAEMRIEQARPASRILMAWHIDSEFLDAQGNPMQLPVEGAVPSFKQLYEKYSGKIVPMTAMLKELQTVGAVQVNPDGLLTVLTRSYTPRPTDPVAMERVCMAIRDMAETGAYNIYRQPGEPARFERFATNQLIPIDEMDNFAAFLDSEAQQFLERADNWLSARESAEPSAQVTRVGVGVYQIAPWVAPEEPKK